MSTIEISTSHNIVVQFELASLGQRILAYIFDFTILFLLTLFMVTVLGPNMFFYIMSFFLWCFYHLAFEFFNNGQSIGKKVLNIRVVHLSGQMPSLNDYMIRWVFRMIETLPALGSVAIIFISSSAKGQRIGDILAQTSVVRKKNENAVQLDSLKNIKSLPEVYYPQVNQFADQDMLLVKHSLHRYRHSPNDANKAVLDQLAKKIADKLNVDLRKVNISDFLDRVLHEYIVLTR